MIQIEEERLVPELRFPEFEGEWGEQILADLLTFKNGLNALKENYGRGYKFINVLDIIQNDFITHEAIIGSVDVSKEEFEKYLVEYGDILFQRSSETREEVGQANVYLDKVEPAAFGGFVIRGKPRTKYDPAFMNYLLKTSRSRKEITSKSGGSTRYNVGQDTLSKVSILTTSLDEQQKIASFLTTVDRRIQLLKRKKAKLEAYKKGVMQRLFAASPLSASRGEPSGLSRLEDEQDQNGKEDHPDILSSGKSSFRQLRFKDENGNDFPDWEEKKFGNAVERVKRKHDPKTDERHFRCIELESLSQNTGKLLHTFDSKEQKSVKNKFEEGHILFGKLRPYLKKYYKATFEGVCSSEIWVLTGNEIDNSFLFYLIQTEKFNYEINLTTGSKMPRAEWNHISEVSFSFPKMQEQQKIAFFLSSIDTAIEKVSDQINTSAAFKKGLLQKMFV